MKRETLEALVRAREGRRAVVLVTDTTTGEGRLVEGAPAADDPLREAIAAGLRSGRSKMLEDGRTFLTVSVPPPRLVAIGAVHISQALAPLARIAGFEVTIVDPRTAFATPDRFPDTNLIAEWPDEALPTIGLDPYTALAALTHDPKIDDGPIAAALAARCFYVGALGSRKTHGRRVERLLAAGVPAEAIEQIRAPIGLAIGAASPAEIAVAVLAEIIEALRRDPAKVG